MRTFASMITFVAGPLVALAVLAAPAVSAEIPQGAYMADGKALFLENKCNSCHSVDAKGVPVVKADKLEADLSKVTADKDFLTKFLKKEVTKTVTKDGAEKQIKHKKLWKGSDEDLDAILSWLKG